MTKSHCHEIEVKYKIDSDRVEKFTTVLDKLGFTPKPTSTIIDKWLPDGKSMIRLREQKRVQKNGKIKTTYEVASKKTIERDGGIKSKCEYEHKVNKVMKVYLLKQAKRKGRAIPKVQKTRTSWVVTIKGRDYTAVIDRVTKLGKHNGFYFELETLIPSDVEDPKASKDVKALAQKILNAAYRGSEGKPTTCELLSYRKMAMANQAKQRRAKKAKQSKAKQTKAKQATTKLLPAKQHCK